MRICVCSRMIDHASGRFCFDDYPCRVAFLKLIGDLHACAWRRAGFGPEGNLGACLVALDGDVVHVHVHGAQVQSVERIEVLRDSGADTVGIAFLVFASTCQDK